MNNRIIDLYILMVKLDYFKLSFYLEWEIMDQNELLVVDIVDWYLMIIITIYLILPTILT